MIKILKNLRKKDIFLILISTLLILVQVYLDLKLPDYMSTITSLVKTSNSKMNDILINGCYMLLCGLGSLISAIIVGYLVALISSNFSKNLRSKLFRKVESLGLEEIQYKKD